jgi:hypothetical protein
MPGNSEKQYVTSDETGELVEVIPAFATAAVAHVSTLSNKDRKGIPELPPGSAKMIEQAMVYAIEQCTRDGITEPDAVREAMMMARESMKQSLRMQMIEQRSQQQAAAQAAEKAAEKAAREK